MEKDERVTDAEPLDTVVEEHRGEKGAAHAFHFGVRVHCRGDVPVGSTERTPQAFRRQAASLQVGVEKAPHGHLACVLAGGHSSHAVGKYREQAGTAIGGRWIRVRSPIVLLRCATADDACDGEVDAFQSSRSGQSNSGPQKAWNLKVVSPS